MCSKIHTKTKVHYVCFCYSTDNDSGLPHGANKKKTFISIQVQHGSVAPVWAECYIVIKMLMQY